MSVLKTFRIFPVPVFAYQIPDHHETNLQLRKYIYGLKEQNPKGLNISNVGGWHSPYFDIQNDPAPKDFLLKVNKILPEVFQDVIGWEFDVKKLNIQAMWAVVNEKNSFNIRHNHPNSYFSAAYYVRTNENAGQIKFFDPKEVKTMYSPRIKISTEFSTNVVKIKPEEGKLLLFPSYLHHSVEENLSDEDRIVISFNINAL